MAPNTCSLIASIFCIGGNYLAKTGLILFEILGMFSITIVGNIVCDANTKEELRKKEEEHAEALAEQITSKLDKLPKKYE